MNNVTENGLLFNLRTGELHLSLKGGKQPFEECCGAAARANPKRGFVFVSKVLGRYTAIKPSSLRRTQEQLAAQIPPSLEGPILVIGLAEAAVGLSHGIHEIYSQSTQREDVLYSHTTRYLIEGLESVSFDEEHSHAPKHYLYWPQEPSVREIVSRVRTLIVIDDESTTRKTFFNIVDELENQLPELKTAVHLVIHDWAEPSNAKKNNNLKFDFHSLTSGQWRFEPAKATHRNYHPTKNAVGNGLDKTAYLNLSFGRTALHTLPACNPEIKPIAKGKILVLGTGEFQYLPFRWAEKLEAEGHDVSFQSTTRSPLLAGVGIESILEFEDGYGDGISNYLYNTHPEQFDQVFLCCESKSHVLPPQLLDYPNLEPVYF